MGKKDKSSEWLTRQQVAELLQIPMGDVDQLIRAGKLTPQHRPIDSEFGMRRYYFRRAEVKKLKSSQVRQSAR